jgi:hypothetical protein
LPAQGESFEAFGLDDGIEAGRHGVKRHQRGIVGRDDAVAARQVLEEGGAEGRAA